MGGQNSKLTPEAEAMPPRILPLLQRKFEEIKSRIRINRLKPDATPSKKQLLKDKEGEADNSMSRSPHSSPDNSLESPKVQEKKTSKVTPVSPLDQNEIEEVKDDQTLENSFEQHKEEQRGKVPKVVPVYIGGVFSLEQAADEDEEEEDEDHEDGMGSINYQMYMCPASPSFRFYCQEALEVEKEFENETDIEEEGKYDSTYSTDEDVNHKKTPSAESNVDIIPENNDGQDIKKKKKTRRRRMKNPFGMGGPNCSVKNLLNVRGCYNTGCGGHDRSALLAEKSAAT